MVHLILTAPISDPFSLISRPLYLIETISNILHPPPSQPSIVLGNEAYNPFKHDSDKYQPSSDDEQDQQGTHVEVDFALHVSYSLRLEVCY